MFARNRQEMYHIITEEEKRSKSGRQWINVYCIYIAIVKWSEMDEDMDELFGIGRHDFDYSW